MEMLSTRTTRIFYCYRLKSKMAQGMLQINMPQWSHGACKSSLPEACHQGECQDFFLKWLPLLCTCQYLVSLPALQQFRSMQSCVSFVKRSGKIKYMKYPRSMLDSSYKRLLMSKATRNGKFS